MSGDEMTLQGFKVVVSHLLKDEPVLRVRDSVPMTLDARNKMNDWLLDMFGVKQTILFDGETFYMAPKYFMQIKSLRGMHP